MLLGRVIVLLCAVAFCLCQPNNVKDRDLVGDWGCIVDQGNFISDPAYDVCLRLETSSRKIHQQYNYVRQPELGQFTYRYSGTNDGGYFTANWFDDWRTYTVQSTLSYDQLYSRPVMPGLNTSHYDSLIQQDFFIQGTSQRCIYKYFDGTSSMWMGCNEVDDPLRPDYYVNATYKFVCNRLQVSCADRFVTTRSAESLAVALEGYWKSLVPVPQYTGCVSISNDNRQFVEESYQVVDGFGVLNSMLKREIDGLRRGGFSDEGLPTFELDYILTDADVQGMSTEVSLTDQSLDLLANQFASAQKGLYVLCLGSLADDLFRLTCGAPDTFVRPTSFQENATLVYVRAQTQEECSASVPNYYDVPDPKIFGSWFVTEFETTSLVTFGVGTNQYCYDVSENSFDITNSFFQVPDQGRVSGTLVGTPSVAGAGPNEEYYYAYDFRTGLSSNVASRATNPAVRPDNFQAFAVQFYRAQQYQDLRCIYQYLEAGNDQILLACNLNSGRPTNISTGSADVQFIMKRSEDCQVRSLTSSFDDARQGHWYQQEVSLENPSGNPNQDACVTSWPDSKPLSNDHYFYLRLLGQSQSNYEQYVSTDGGWASAV